MPHKSLEMFILINVLCVFKTACTDFEQMNIVQFDLYPEIFSATDISLY